MQITFINVGYGDAILIQQGAFTLLVDGGSTLPQEFEGFPDRIPARDFLAAQGISRIDLAVLSHIHEDHTCGFADIAAHFPIGAIALPCQPDVLRGVQRLKPNAQAARSVPLFTKALHDAEQIVKLADNRGSPVHTLRCGDVLTPVNGLRIEVLAPPVQIATDFEAQIVQAEPQDDPTPALTQLDRTSNDTSLVLKVTDGKLCCLLPGDNCPHNWNHIDFSLLENVNVLKLPHHGQIDSIDPKIVQKMPLQAIITTAASDRRYNSANPEVYRVLHNIHPDAQLLFTDERAYPPYFSNPHGAQAVTLRMNCGLIQTEWMKMNSTEEKEKKP